LILRTLRSSVGARTRAHLCRLSVGVCGVNWPRECVLPLEGENRDERNDDDAVGRRSAQLNVASHLDLSVPSPGRTVKRNASLSEVAGASGASMRRGGGPARRPSTSGRSGASRESRAAAPAPSRSADTRPAAATPASSSASAPPAARVCLPARSPDPRPTRDSRISTPWRSSMSSRSESVRGLIPGQACSSSMNRRGPSERSCRSSAVHLVPMISAVAATAQLPSCTSFIVRFIWTSVY
jgi:hypothetical protein